MISLGTISNIYGERIDVRVDGGTALRNVTVASNIPRGLLSTGRRVCVLTVPKPLIIAVVSDEALEDTVAVHFEKTGSMIIDGVMDIILPGILKCRASGFMAGTGFWLAYNKGVPQLFVGSDTGQYIAWDGTDLIINGNLKVKGTHNIVTEYGLVSEAPNLAKNPDFGIFHAGFGIAEDWVLSGQAVLLEKV